MAFSTEFVMGAGGGVEYFSVPVSAKTGGGEVTLATAQVGEGTWVATYIAPLDRYGTWFAEVIPGPIPRRASQQYSMAAPIGSTAQVVTGPATVSVVGLTSHKSGEGILHLVRIG